MNEDVQSKYSIGVIGAGIQGVCISLSLIKKGFKSLNKSDIFSIPFFS